MPSISRRTGLACLLATSGLLACLAADEPHNGATSPARWKQHDVRRPKPPVIKGTRVDERRRRPEDAIVLFDGSNLDAWKSSRGGGPAAWKVVNDYMETVPGAGPIETKAKFGDIQLHVEWAAPAPAHGTGQDRGNSGIFLMGQFEIQVLDSYKAETYADGQAGAIYGQYPPLFNASLPPGELQAYDIAFRRPRFDSSGKLLEPARITLFHNGVLVQNNEEPFGPTSWLKWLPYADQGARGPISLQDHDHPVRYANIWVRELPERPAPTAANLARPKAIALSTAVLDRYAGEYRMGEKPGASVAKITRDGDHLTVAFPFRPGALELVPTSETEFDMPFTDGHFTFHADAKGKASSVLFRVGDSEREMKRVEP